MVTTSSLLRLLAVLWLAAVPAFAAAHEAEHAGDAFVDHLSCAACQIGERDGDALLPALPGVERAAPQTLTVLPGEDGVALALSRPLHPIRGPPSLG